MRKHTQTCTYFKEKFNWFQVAGAVQNLCTQIIGFTKYRDRLLEKAYDGA